MGSRQKNSGRRICQTSKKSGTWKERVEETQIVTTEGLTTCLNPGRGWTITSGGWNLLRKKERRKGQEQEFITIIHQETKRTEEKEAGYMLPTWKVLRALQQISNATRSEGKAMMSAPPFFESAGRGKLTFGARRKEQR